MIVTRFAPSPTGFLHIGHAFAALTASSGSDRFLLRIEDIDRTRARDSYREAIFEDLAWLGIRWESPVRVQSEHFDDYRAALNVLAGNGLLYPCFCTRREITEAANAPHQGPDGPRYPGSCRKLSSEERQHRIARDDAYALRLDVEKALAATNTRLTFQDRGTEHIATPEIFGDVVLARKELPASYHLAVTVDDALQGVTRVTRGEDLLPATHIQRLLQALLQLPVPEYAHHRLILAASGSKFSKRDGTVNLRELRANGVTPGDIKRMVGFSGA